MELFLVYLWLKLDTIITLSALFSLVFGILSVILLAMIWSHGFNDYERKQQEWDIDHAPTWKKRRNVVVTIFTIAFCISVFVPSSRDTAILVGSAVAIDMAKSPEGQKISALIRGKANEYLDAELNKLKEKK